MIQHKWHTWAQRLVLLELFAYLTWLACFSAWSVVLSYEDHPSPDKGPPLPDAPPSEPPFTLTDALTVLTTTTPPPAAGAALGMLAAVGAAVGDAAQVQVAGWSVLALLLLGL